MVTTMQHHIKEQATLLSRISEIKKKKAIKVRHTTIDKNTFTVNKRLYTYFDSIKTPSRKSSRLAQIKNNEEISN